MRTLTFIALMMISIAAVAAPVFTPAERAEAWRYTQAHLVQLTAQSGLDACIARARAGDDAALAALFLIARIHRDMGTISSERQKLLKEAGTRADVSRTLRSRYAKEDARRLQKYLLIYPRSLSFCRSISG